MRSGRKKILMMEHSVIFPDHRKVCALGQGSAYFAEEFHPFKAVDDLLGNGVAGFHFRTFQPADMCIRDRN